MWDASDPHRLGRFWAAALGADPMTDEPDAVEARLRLTDDVFLDLCFQHVASPSAAPARLHLDLSGGARQQEVVQRLLDLGAEHTDIGQGAVPWVVLTDPEGNAFCVMENREVHRDTGPIAALPLDSADPDRDAAFWAEITGWTAVGGDAGAATLRHPSAVGPLVAARRGDGGGVEPGLLARFAQRGLLGRLVVVAGATEDPPGATVVAPQRGAAAGAGRRATPAGPRRRRSPSAGGPANTGSSRHRRRGGTPRRQLRQRAGSYPGSCRPSC